MRSRFEYGVDSLIGLERLAHGAQRLLHFVECLFNSGDILIRHESRLDSRNTGCHLGMGPHDVGGECTEMLGHQLYGYFARYF